jgi:hypothetical protein
MIAFISDCRSSTTITVTQLHYIYITAVMCVRLRLQIAHHKGYIKVDWNRMTTDSTSFADKVCNQQCVEILSLHRSLKM